MAASLLAASLTIATTTRATTLPASIHATTVPRRLLVVLPDGLAVLTCPGPHLTKDSVCWYTYINAIPGLDPRTGATRRRAPTSIRRHRCAQRREWRGNRRAPPAPRQPHFHRRRRPPRGTTSHVGNRSGP